MRGRSSVVQLARGIREYLPNYTVACVRPSRDLGKNVAAFRVDMKMNKPEISAYLRSIYGLDVLKVQTQVVLGKVKRARNNLRYKRSDYKLAYVTLPEPFEFPNIFPSDAELEELQRQQELKEQPHTEE